MKKKTPAKKRPAKKAPPKSKALNQAAVTNAMISNNVGDTMPAGPGAQSAPAAAVYGKHKAPSFFSAPADNQGTLVAPGVYRERGGSHTTILCYVGRTRCLHVRMDCAGLVVTRTDVKDFSAAWTAAPYDVKRAAKKYLEAVGYFIEVHPRAGAGLTAIAAGKDAAAVKVAMDKALADEADDQGGGNDLASGLRRAAKSVKKSKGGLPKGRGIGAWVCEQLCAKVGDEKILKEVVKKFPGAKTNLAHLNWYRNKLKRKGALS